MLSLSIKSSTTSPKFHVSFAQYPRDDRFAGRERDVLCGVWEDEEYTYTNLWEFSDVKYPRIRARWTRPPNWLCIDETRKGLLHKELHYWFLTFYSMKILTLILNERLWRQSFDSNLSKFISTNYFSSKKSGNFKSDCINGIIIRL